jgi:ferredoxin
MKIVIIAVEEGKCVAAGQCVVVAPAVFDQRDDVAPRALRIEPGGAPVTGAA